MDRSFDVSVQHLGGVALVRPEGELDLASAPALRRALRTFEQPCDRVVVDLGGVEFIDSVGLTLFVREHRRALDDGYELVLAGGDEPVLRTFRLAALDGALRFVPDVDTALRPVQHPEA